MIRDAANTALTHDPSYAPAYGRLALLEGVLERDYPAAAQHLEQGLALDSSNLDLIFAGAVIARRLNRLDQAIELGEYHVTRDPVNVDAYDSLGLAYRYSGQLDKAISAYRLVLSLSPDAAWEHAALGVVLLDKNDARSALAEFQKEPVERFRLWGSSMAHHALSQRPASDAALSELIEKYAATYPYEIGGALAFRGEVDRAFLMLDRAARQGSIDLGSLPIYPAFKNLHDDPRWLPFLRKLGMAPEQLAAIKFDVTVPK